MLTPLCLRWETEAQKCVLTFSSHTSKPSHTEASPTRKQERQVLSHLPGRVPSPAYANYTQRGRGMDTDGEKGECNSNDVGDTIYPYTQHKCTLCK